MNPKAIINELRRINDWRRGDETVGQPAPGHFGDVLDAAAETLASLVASNTTLRRERDNARGSLKLRKADVSRQWAVNAELKAELARVTTERSELMAMLNRVAREGFGLDDTIGGEPYDAYLLRKIAELRSDRARLSGGVELIAEERARQISVEGWTPEHDDKHTDGEMANASACYVVGNTSSLRRHFVATFWPWELQWWKPSPENRVRELVKAGALIAAEIDRLQRAAMKEAAR